MKRTVAALAILMAFAGVGRADSNVPPLIEEGKKVIKAFGGELKGVLEKGIQEHGTVDTITACSKMAPAIADQHAQSSGWKVARTSLKVRNPDNAPDAWELAVLKDFETRKAAGEDATKLVKAEVVDDGGKKVFRMMVAIPTAAVCTKCHGANMEKPAVEAITELYPKDQAIGFKEGDIRGAFTLKKPL